MEEISGGGFFRFRSENIYLKNEPKEGRPRFLIPKI